MAAGIRAWLLLAALPAILSLDIIKMIEEFNEEMAVQPVGLPRLPSPQPNDKAGEDDVLNDLDIIDQLVEEAAGDIPSWVHEQAEAHSDVMPEPKRRRTDSGLGGGSTTVTMAEEVKQGPQFEEVGKYFEGVAEDRTKVTWAHRVNSRQALLAALNDSKTMMLEADVSFGKVNNTGDEMPVMAHGATDEVDLSLKEFLKTVNDTLKAGTVKKGVKLDFKSELAFNKSRDVIQEARKAMAKPYPLWLNADILMGPGSADKGNVNPDVFLNESSILFPSAGLSVGWTTKISPGDTSSCYTPEQFKSMSNYLQKYNLHNSDNVTLAVRAIYAGRCSDKLVDWLDSNLKNATLTLWTGDNDNPKTDQLKNLIAKVTKKRIYVDLPDALREQVLNDTTPGSSSSRIGSIASLILFPFTLALWRLQ